MIIDNLLELIAFLIRGFQDILFLGDSHDGLLFPFLLTDSMLSGDSRFAVRNIF